MMQRIKLRGQQCQCAACGAAFRTVRSFDTHRIGKATERACAGPALLQEWGFTLDSGGFWRSPGRKGGFVHWRTP